MRRASHSAVPCSTLWIFTSHLPAEFWKEEPDEPLERFEHPSHRESGNVPTPGMPPYLLLSFAEAKSAHPFASRK
ncbi:hypothetical protein GFGA_1d1178 [Gluconobacter frateurii NBRC 103465]|nr:hypothetical protein GFGA_1d1178 [Gluconobacter frateurii NBRC 103465]